MSTPKTERYVHHGKEVAVISELKGRHREHCLCYSCDRFNPMTDGPTQCRIANAVFENCVKFGIVSPIWECPDYLLKTNA